MKEKYQSEFISIFIFSMLFIVSVKVNGQTTVPVELNNNTLKEQLNYLEQRTRIYENYRAIREDMFQKLKMNITDSLAEATGTIAVLNHKASALKLAIDSLNNTLSSTIASLNETTRTKNRIRVFGMEVNKVAYNTIMWAIVAGLVAVLMIGFVILNRNISVTQSTKKELKELKDEFEAYRKTTREAREKMSMDHFNELKKLRGG